MNNGASRNVLYLVVSCKESTAFPFVTVKCLQKNIRFSQNGDSLEPNKCIRQSMVTTGKEETRKISYLNQ